MVEQTWRILTDKQRFSAGVALALDEALLDSVQQPTLRLWQNHDCLVLGRFDSRLPEFDRAYDAFTESDVTVLQRQSGGTAVCHGAGILNVSIIVPNGVAPEGVHEGFEALAQPMLDGFLALGHDAYFGSVSNTFCDGPHNIVIDGNKIAGLAQRRRRQGVLVHAVILVNNHLDSMHDLLEEFYALAGKPTQFARQRVVNLSQLVSTKAIVDLREAILKAYVRNKKFFLDAYSQDEINLSKALANTHSIRTSP